MAVLVLDTATEVCAVAVGEADETGQLQLLASTAIRVPRSHSRRLQPAIADVLAHAGLAMADLTAIGVGVGPGSYTGVRIAVSTAKVMAWALGIPLHPISTLAALAASIVPQHIGTQAVALPLLYARRGRAFGALYRIDAGRAGTGRAGETVTVPPAGAQWSCLIEPTVLPVSVWRAQLAALTAERLVSFVVHDFQPRYGLADEVSAMAAAAGTMVESLAERAGSVGRGLLTAIASTTAVTGDAIHAVEPTYLLQTEAETKLAGGNRPE